MSTIRIITGADSAYKQFYEKLKVDAEKFGYNFSGYDFGDLGEGKKFDIKLNNILHNTGVYQGKIPDKPKMILDALNWFNDEFIVYLDSDVRIRKPIDEIVGDYDVGITVHDPIHHDGKILSEVYPHITCYLNAGVIFLKNNQKAKDFIEEWIKDVPYTKTNSDQEALTNLLRRHVTDWSLGDKDVNGVKVRFFPSWIYNFLSRYGYVSDPKIVHYTGIVQDKINAGILN